MTKVDENIKSAQNLLSGIVERCHELEEENKKLKEDLEQFSEAYKRYRDYEKEELAESCYDLERENKKLREIITDLSKSNYKSVNQRKDLERENQKLKEERDELKKEFQQYKEHYNTEKDKQQIFLMTGLRY